MISGENVCCSVVFHTLVGVLVFAVMWSQKIVGTIIEPEIVSKIGLKNLVKMWSRKLGSK